MRILHFSDKDTDGGAAKAAHRLHCALRDAGQQSKMVVFRKTSVDADVHQVQPPIPLGPLAYEYNRFKKRFLGNKRSHPTANYTFNFNLEPEIFEPDLFNESKIDIICLHWLSRLLNPRLIKALHDHYQCPIVWITADQEAVTGGCHYSFGCNNFTDSCGRCPQLDQSGPNDHSHRTWLDKRKYLSDIPITFVAPTSWCAEKIRQSSLFKDHKVENIPYPIDVKTFRPIDRRIARDLLQIPQDKKIIFFGATYTDDKRKGMNHLIQALNLASVKIDPNSKVKRDDIFLLVAGLNGDAILSQLPFDGKYTGLLHDDITLALAYQAAGIFLCPSLEDAGPMMISEALLCGTPVVAFNTGIAPDIIENSLNGYVANIGDPEDLAHGIIQILTSNDHQNLSNYAHSKALGVHDPTTVAAKHIDLYQQLS